MRIIHPGQMIECMKIHIIISGLMFKNKSSHQMDSIDLFTCSLHCMVCFPISDHVMVSDENF